MGSPAAPRNALRSWFQEHKRDLPWRRTRDPYRIWVSEIMLQQTRVAAVLEHYARWLEHFPSVAALAAALEAEVLALWSGLGYYRRARFLHAAAKRVVAEHGGQLPATYAGLRTLPGIGDYTAAAVSSIAFGEAVAAVDGNVERVVARLYALVPSRAEAAVFAPGPGEAAALAANIRTRAAELLDREHPGDHNQAMMELGATVCLPRAPLCLQCPLFAHCQTRGEHATVARAPLRARTVVYQLAVQPGDVDGEQHVLLRQRAPDSSLMAGMWELPEAEPGTGSTPLLTLKHAITVTNYQVLIVPAAEPVGELHGRWIPVAELPRTALTGLARKVLRRLQLWPQPAAKTLLR